MYYSSPYNPLEATMSPIFLTKESNNTSLTSGLFLSIKYVELSLWFQNVAPFEFPLTLTWTRQTSKNYLISWSMISSFRCDSVLNMCIRMHPSNLGIIRHKHMNLKWTHHLVIPLAPLSMWFSCNHSKHGLVLKFLPINKNQTN